MDIQATKLELMQMLLDTQQEHVLERVKQILEEETDFWDHLEIGDQQAIDQGLSELDNGKFITQKEAENEIDKLFNSKG